mmetsp:Transcript_23290/g.58922  ORF Transcript_23290/g.58922 Transcript_23290/m.58922 type:complete len:318 (-) Transcript_23290:1436-2389(-)
MDAASSILSDHMIGRSLQAAFVGRDCVLDVEEGRIRRRALQQLEQLLGHDGNVPPVLVPLREIHLIPQIPPLAHEQVQNRQEQFVVGNHRFPDRGPPGYELAEDLDALADDVPVLFHHVPVDALHGFWQRRQQPLLVQRLDHRHGTFEADVVEGEFSLADAVDEDGQEDPGVDAFHGDPPLQGHLRPVLDRDRQVATLKHLPELGTWILQGVEGEVRNVEPLVDDGLERVGCFRPGAPLRGAAGKVGGTAPPQKVLPLHRRGVDGKVAGTQPRSGHFQWVFLFCSSSQRSRGARPLRFLFIGVLLRGAEDVFRVLAE